MNTKTKTKTNLKRAILFFIPLCLIAGMFAVPAFAVTHVAWNNVDATTTLEPTTITEYVNAPGFASGVSTAGMYALVFDNLKGDIQEGDPSSNINLFPNFDGVGYLEVDFGNSVSYYIFGSGLQTDGDDITIGITYDIMHEDYALELDARVGSYGAVFVGGATCTFYFTQYPPVEITGAYSDALYFWNDWATYNVYMVSEGSVTPDPEPPAGGDDGEGETSGIFAVWTQITDWIINGLKSTTNAFYYNGQLTLLGYLCIIPLALGVALLLISIIQKFLRLRG